jgi:hypothetical protein
MFTAAWMLVKCYEKNDLLLQNSWNFNPLAFVYVLIFILVYKVML